LNAEKRLILLTTLSVFMDGIEALLLKWDEMNNIQKGFVLVLGFGALAIALSQILDFIYKWVLPNIPYIQNAIQKLPDWITSIISSFFPVYLPLVLLYTIVTVYLAQRAQDRTTMKFNAEVSRLIREISQLREDNAYLFDKVQTYKSIEDNLKVPSFKPILADIVLDLTTPDDVKLGEIQGRIKKLTR